MALLNDNTLTSLHIGYRPELAATRALELPPDLMAFYGSAVHAGEHVTPATAVQVAAVFACIRIIANAFASLPFITYQRDGEARQRATGHYLYSLLKDKVNPHLTSFLWKQHLATSLLTHGNSYSQAIFNGRMQTTALYPLNPARMTVTRTPAGLKYEYMTDAGQQELLADTVLHVRFLTTDGFTGLSPLSAARQACGISLAAEKHVGSFFQNGMSVTEVVSFPDTPPADKAAGIKSALLEEHQGARNAYRPLFLFGNGKLERLSLNHADIQFLELRRFTVAEIARVFGVPLHMLGELEKATYASVEMMSMEFMRDTLRPLAANVEAEVNCTLLSDRERESVFAEFLLDSYTRADIKSRYEALGRAVGNGNAWLTPNEARRFENLPPVENGDKLHIPRQNTPEPTKESAE